MAELNTPNREVLLPENDIDNSLANSMSNKLHELSAQPDQIEPLTIFRVPEYICCKHRELYKPQIISIGPYHRGSKSLELMEEQKWRSLHQLLNHQKADCSLIDLVKVVRSLEAKARSAYKENVCLNSNEFVEMMVLDGCFIIQFLSKSDHENVDNGISIRDSDLLLLENQIPFFIIRSLYFKIFSQNKDYNLYFLLGNFMFSATTIKELEQPAKYPVHLVHLYYHWFLLTRASETTNNAKPCRKRISSFRYSCSSSQRELPKHSRVISPGVPCVKLTTRAPIKVIPTATALNEAGVKFKRTSSCDLFRVTFHKGVMEISSIILDNTRKRLFLNLIAFEQSQSKREKDLTSFAKLMDMLIDTPKDVAILEKSGILHNLLASADEAAHFFNQICECATIDYNNNYLAEVIQDVRQYCDSSWHKHRARLMRDYFNNPWSIISLIAGIILLILSFLQVYFAAYPFFKYP